MKKIYFICTACYLAVPTHTRTSVPIIFFCFLCQLFFPYIYMEKYIHVMEKYFLPLKFTPFYLHNSDRFLFFLFIAFTLFSNSFMLYILAILKLSILAYDCYKMCQCVSYARPKRGHIYILHLCVIFLPLFRGFNTHLIVFFVIKSLQILFIKKENVIYLCDYIY